MNQDFPSLNESNPQVDRRRRRIPLFILALDPVGWIQCGMMLSLDALGSTIPAETWLLDTMRHDAPLPVTQLAALSASTRGVP
jgi:hypothetical protein